MSIDTLHVCMYTPSSAGGHALYTQELLTALAEVGPGRGIAPELVTSEDLAAAHWTSAYPIHPILPRLTPRREYRTALVWAWSRMIHYTRRRADFPRLVGRPTGPQPHPLPGVHMLAGPPALPRTPPARPGNRLDRS